MDVGIIGAGTASAHAIQQRLLQDGFAAALLEPAALAGGELPRYLVHCALAPETAAVDGAPVLSPRWRDELVQVIDAARRGDCGLIFLSSSQVYEGARPAQHLETDATVPLSPYALALADAGALVRDALPRRVVLRTGPLIAATGTPLQALLQPLLAGQTLVLDDRQQVFPTPVEDLARVVAAMLRQLDCGAPRWGTYHYQGSDWCTWYQFADALIAQARQYRQLPGRIQVAEGEPAVFGGGLPLSCRKLLNTFGIKQRCWRPALAGMVREALGAAAAA